MNNVVSPRDRLLETAMQLFYAEGIQAVGVDRLVREANVTRATFYRHFDGKEELVAAYIRNRDGALRRQYAEVTAVLTDPVELIRAVAIGVITDVCGDGFRGCPFINAAAEHPSEGVVRQAVAAHRKWFLDILRDLYTRANHPDPEDAAHRTNLLRDGAMVAGYLDDPEAAIRTFKSGVASVVAQIPNAPTLAF